MHTKYITPREYAATRNLGYREVLDMLKEGTIHGEKVGNKWRIPTYYSFLTDEQKGTKNGTESESGLRDESARNSASTSCENENKNTDSCDTVIIPASEIFPEDEVEAEYDPQDDTIAGYEPYKSPAITELTANLTDTIGELEDEIAALRKENEALKAQLAQCNGKPSWLRRIFRGRKKEIHIRNMVGCGLKSENGNTLRIKRGK